MNLKTSIIAYYTLFLGYKVLRDQVTVARMQTNPLKFVCRVLPKISAKYVRDYFYGGSRRIIRE